MLRLKSLPAPSGLVSVLHIKLTPIDATSNDRGHAGAVKYHSPSPRSQTHKPSRSPSFPSEFLFLSTGDTYAVPPMMSPSATTSSTLAVSTPASSPSTRVTAGVAVFSTWTSNSRQAVWLEWTMICHSTSAVIVPAPDIVRTAMLAVVIMSHAQLYHYQQHWQQQQHGGEGLTQQSPFCHQEGKHTHPELMHFIQAIHTNMPSRGEPWHCPSRPHMTTGTNGAK